MAKTVFITFGWQTDEIPTPLTVEDNQTLREALRPLLPAGMTPDEIESAYDESGANVINQRGSQLKDGVEIKLQRTKFAKGGLFQTNPRF